MPVALGGLVTLLVRGGIVCPYDGFLGSAGLADLSSGLDPNGERKLPKPPAGLSSFLSAGFADLSSGFAPNGERNPPSGPAGLSSFLSAGRDELDELD